MNCKGGCSREASQRLQSVVTGVNTFSWKRTTASYCSKYVVFASPIYDTFTSYCNSRHPCVVPLNTYMYILCITLRFSSVSYSRFAEQTLLCGAFYPNYFMQQPIDEAAANKRMSGHAHTNTVEVGTSSTFVKHAILIALS